VGKNGPAQNERPEGTYGSFKVISAAIKQVPVVRFALGLAQFSAIWFGIAEVEQ
jgi:hypothetical protein